MKQKKLHAAAFFYESGIIQCGSLFAAGARFAFAAAGISLLAFLFGLFDSIFFAIGFTAGTASHED